MFSDVYTLVPLTIQLIVQVCFSSIKHPKAATHCDSHPSRPEIFIPGELWRYLIDNFGSNLLVLRLTARQLNTAVVIVFQSNTYFHRIQKG